MKQQFSFTFRKIKASVLRELVQSLDVPESEVMAQFEAQDESKAEYRRKPVTVELEIPEFAASLPELAREVIANYVAQFVKATYIDNFVSVGAHDWETINKAVAERSVGGRRAQFDIADDVLKLAAASVGQYITAVTGHKVVGEKVQKAIEQKFSRSAIHRNIGEITGDLMDKLSARLESWLEHVASADPDNADDFADVFSMLMAKIDGIRKQDVVNVAAAL
jgi:hypothetical protein